MIRDPSTSSPVALIALAALAAAGLRQRVAVLRPAVRSARRRPLRRRRRRAATRRGASASTPSIPAYQSTSGISGNLSSVGSDTMNNLMTLWGETFSRLYPEREAAGGGQGLLHRAPGPHRGHGAVRARCRGR